MHYGATQSRDRATTDKSTKRGARPHCRQAQQARPQKCPINLQTSVRHCDTAPLFDGGLSIFPIDIKIFMAVSNHPRFSKTVKTVIYNVLRLPNVRRSRYVPKTKDQSSWDLYESNPGSDPVEAGKLVQRLSYTNYIYPHERSTYCFNRSFIL